MPPRLRGILTKIEERFMGRPTDEMNEGFQQIGEGRVNEMFAGFRRRMNISAMGATLPNVADALTNGMITPAMALGKRLADAAMKPRYSQIENKPLANRNVMRDIYNEGTEAEIISMSHAINMQTKYGTCS
jgi:hypothetical protein